MRISKRDLTPIMILGGINLFTLFLLLLSPFNYLYGDYISSFFYVLFNLCFLFIGYIIAVSICNNSHYINIKVYNFNSEVNIFKLLLLIFVLTGIFRYSYIMRYQFYDISSILSGIAIGIADPKIGYILSIENTRAFTIPWSFYAFLTIFHTLFFITGAIVWKNISFFYKFCYLLLILMEGVFWYSQGTNFGIINLAVIFLLAYLLNVNKINVKFVINIFFFIVVVLSIFSVVMYSRLKDITDLSAYEIYLTSINYDSNLLKITPEPLKPILLTVFSYVTQGYYFLSFGFDLDYKFSYFLSSNSTLTDISRLLSINIADNSMVNRLSVFGIDPNVQWHSAYLWIASDFSFYFVPIYIFFLGAILGTSWVLATKCNDYIFKIIFIIIGGSIFFLFANNNFIGLYFYLLLFSFTIVFIKFYFLLKKTRG